jgi:hypothetical protein
VLWKSISSVFKKLGIFLADSFACRDMVSNFS